MKITGVVKTYPTTNLAYRYREGAPWQLRISTLFDINY